MFLCGSNWRVALCVISLLGAAAVRGWASYHEPSTGAGLTGENAIEVARPLFAAVTGEVQDLTFEATPTVMRTPPHDRTLWVVYCESASRGPLAYAVIDRELGEAVTVHDTLPEPRSGKMKPLNSRQALASAKGWLIDLGVAASERRWRLTAPPELSPQGWSVTWKAGWRTATIVIDGATGDLVGAEIMRARR